MCTIRQHCSICDTNFDSVTKYYTLECPQHAEATSNARSKYVGKDKDWCQAIGIVCNKCSKKIDEESKTPTLVSKARQDGALKRRLRCKLLSKKKEADEERLSEERRVDAVNAAKVAKVKKAAEAEKTTLAVEKEMKKADV